MPIDFDKTQELESTTNLRNFFAGWGSRVRTILNDSLGASNPFGTAATRDIGTGANQIPVLGPGGTIAGNRIQTASATQNGKVLLSAGATSDASRGGIPLVLLASQVKGLLDNITGGLSADNIRIAYYRASTFTRRGFYPSRGAGLLIFAGTGVTSLYGGGLITTAPTILSSSRGSVTARGGWAIRASEGRVGGYFPNPNRPALYGSRLLSTAELGNLGSEFVGGIMLQGFGGASNYAPNDSLARGDLVIAIKRETPSGQRTLLRQPSIQRFSDQTDFVLLLSF